MKWYFPVGDERIEVDLDSESGHNWTRIRDNEYLLRIGHVSYAIDSIRVNAETVSFRMDGTAYDIPYLDEQARLLENLGFRKHATVSKGKLKAPMPGRIVSIHVEPGEVVSSGQRLIVLEAMKMENELRSLIDGTVTAVHVASGQSVEKNTILIDVQPLG